MFLLRGNFPEQTASNATITLLTWNCEICRAGGVWGDSAQGGAVAEREESRSPAPRPTLHTAHCILRVVFGGNYGSGRILTRQTKHSTFEGKK